MDNTFKDKLHHFIFSECLVEFLVSGCWGRGGGLGKAGG